MRKKRHREKGKSNTCAYRIYLPKGYIRFPDGQKVELYSIGVISDVLVRDWREIRDWEFRGLIPLSPFCDAFGRRLYTKDMIRTISQCAEEYKVPVKGGRCHQPFKQRAFFINLAVRLEKLYHIYEARLEMKFPKEIEEKNKKFIRKCVIQSSAYKEYIQMKKERENDEALKEQRRKERSERFWKRWREDANFRESTNRYFYCRERFYERIGNFAAAESIRKGRRKYYDENGTCLIPCET